MRLKETIKNIFFKSNLEFLNEGDVIWAKRYSNEKEKLDIKEGHRESPYIIIKKTKRKVYGVECTTNNNTNKNIITKLPLSNRKYPFLKDCYANMEKVVLLNRERYVKKIGIIDEDDLEKIYRILVVLNSIGEPTNIIKN